MKEKTRNFFRHPLVVGILGTFIGGLLTFHFTATIVENATVELMSRRLEIVEENDTLEEAINNVTLALEEKEEKIIELTNEKETLENLLNDDTKDKDIEKLKDQISQKDKEIEDLKRQVSQKEQEVSAKQGELEAKQEELESLKSKKYNEYIENAQSSTPVLLSDAEVLKNEGININQAGDVSVNGTSFAHFIEPDFSSKGYLEFKLDNQYSEFRGKVYVTKWAYDYFEQDDPEISSASIIIEVKYGDGSSYQVVDQKSGLIADNAPVDIGADLIGATRLKITFGGAHNYNHAVIRLGDPVLYKANS